MEAVQIKVNEGRNRKEMSNLFLFSGGKTVSIFGSAIYNFALSLYVLKLTGSALSFALALMIGLIPMIIINPFAGVIADKFNKKTLVISMDFLNALLLVSVYFLSRQYGLNLLMIYSTTFLMTVFTTFFGVGFEAAKPNMVTDKMLMNINSISKIIDSVSLILGPMLGGLVYALFDIRSFIIINGISFLFSGLSTIFIDFNFQDDQKDERAVKEKIHFMRDIKEGLSYLLERKNIKNLFLVMVSLNFFLGFSLTVPLPYMINNVLKLGSKEFGLIQGAFPAGMIVGALIVKKITERLSYSTLLNVLSFFLAMFMVISGIPVLMKNFEWDHNLYVAYFATVMLFFGVIVALIDIPISYLMQKIIPEEYRGRVLSIGISIGKTMLPLAMLSSGALLGIIPSYIIPIGGGVLFFIFNRVSSSKVVINLEENGEKENTFIEQQLQDKKSPAS
ncbi:MAG: MFS transporter [Bacillota bacterium]|nr:MFS transporter [Bacillota bacterium]